MHITVDYRSDSPIDPKGGRRSSHDLTLELLLVFRALDVLLSETELSADKRAQCQAAVDACRAATLEACRTAID